jgi:type VI secretion system secreted protein VgrG
VPLGLVTVTPLAGNELHFYSMSASEEMGRPFEFVVDVLSKNSDVKIVDALGQMMTVTAELTELRGLRHFNGYVTRFSQVGMVGNFYQYRAILHPWLWFLGRTADCRIFQDHGVPDVVKKVFRKYQMNLFDDALEKPGSDYPPRDYVVQYRETDLNFVSRLLEDVGISYHFVHGPTNHTLVLTDSIGGRKRQAGYEKVMLRPPTESGNLECLTSWNATQEIKTAGYVLRDFDYLKAGAPLLAQRIPGQDKNRFLMGEFYDYPGSYLKQDEGDRAALVRLNETQSYYETIQTDGPIRGLGVGNIFMVVDAPWSDGKKEHLIIGAQYELSGHDPESGDGADEDVFHASFTLVDSQVFFRPTRLSPRPVVQGPQTAIVVGPKKDDDNPEEIWTDDNGRILVRFHWERLGAAKPADPERADDDKDNETNPCFVRVASLWAGQQWGIQFTPRIGQEVIVEFLEGDPDRPIVTGAVYNSTHKPPYANKNKTQSGIKTHSTTGAGPTNFNEIRFEDKKGSEELFIQAEKDQTTKVKHNQSISVGADRSVSVGGNESISVQGTRSSTITKKETQTFNDAREMKVKLTNLDEITGHHTGKYQDGREETVEKGDKLTVVGSDKTDSVEGKYDITAKTEFKVIQGSNTVLVKDAILLDNSKCQVQLKGGDATISAADSITLVCGAASIKLSKDGSIEINGSQKVAIGGGGSSVELQAAGASVSGTKVTVSGTAMTEITGAMVKIN